MAETDSTVYWEQDHQAASVRSCSIRVAIFRDCQANLNFLTGAAILHVAVAVLWPGFIAVFTAHIRKIFARQLVKPEKPSETGIFIISNHILINCLNNSDHTLIRAEKPLCLVY